VNDAFSKTSNEVRWRRSSFVVRRSSFVVGFRCWFSVLRDDE